MSPPTTGSKALQPDRSSQSGVPPTSERASVKKSVPRVAAGTKPDDLTALSDIESIDKSALYNSRVITFKQISQMTPELLDRVLQKGRAPKKGGQRCAKLIAEAKSMVEEVAAIERVPDTPVHTGPVTAVAFSPDGTRIASASDDMTLKLWEGSGEQKLVRTIKGHRNNLKSVAFNHRGNWVVTGSWDKTVILWATRNGKRLQTFKGHSAPVWSVAFSPAGLKIVSGGEDGIKLWDVSIGALSRSFEGHSDTVTSVAFSRDGKKIVSGSYDCLLYTSPSPRDATLSRMPSSA